MLQILHVMNWGCGAYEKYLILIIKCASYEDVKHKIFATFKMFGRFHFQDYPLLGFSIPKNFFPPFVVEVHFDTISLLYFNKARRRKILNEFRIMLMAEPVWVNLWNNQV